MRSTPLLERNRENSPKTIIQIREASTRRKTDYAASKALGQALDQAIYGNSEIGNFE